MGRISLAFRAFFAVLGSSATGQRVAAALAGESASAALPVAAARSEPAPAPDPKPSRSDALTLLATLQREARLIDFLMEPIDHYTDQQIGAATRDVHRQSAAVVQRFFDLAPLTTQAEGATIDIPAGGSAHEYHLTGNVSGPGPYRGTVCHHGWRAQRCQLPEWSGEAVAAMIVAPIEVEIK